MLKHTFFISVALLCPTLGIAASFNSSDINSVVQPGTYDSFYDDGSANLAVIRDKFGMINGIPEGVSISYSGSERISYASGIYIRPKSGSISGVGDIFANIEMNFDAYDTTSTHVCGITTWKSSQADGKNIFVDTIRVDANTNSSGNKSVSACGIYNYTSSLGKILGNAQSAQIYAHSSSFTATGIYNSYSSSISGISEIAILAVSEGNAGAYGINNEGYGSSNIGDIENVSIDVSSVSESAFSYGIYNAGHVGNLDNVKISVTGKGSVYGIYSDEGEVGNISNSSISANGGADTIGVFLSYGGSVGTLDNVNISAASAGGGFCAGILTTSPATLNFKNGCVVSAIGQPGGDAYSISNESSGELVLNGDATFHTLNGNIYSKGKLVFNGNFALKDASVALKDSMLVKSGSSLEWSGVLYVSGGESVFEDGAILNIVIDDVDVAEEYLVFSSDETITLNANEINLHVFNSDHSELYGYSLELRTSPDGLNNLYITIPEPSCIAAAFGIFAFIFTMCLRKRIHRSHDAS